MPGLTRGLALFSHKVVPGRCSVDPEAELVPLAFHSGLSDKRDERWVWSVTLFKVGKFKAEN